jgi:hypothetical protein
MFTKRPSPTELMAQQKLDAKDTTQNVYRINPKTGAIEPMGSVEKGSHFATEPPPPTPHYSAQDRYDETGTPHSGILNTLTGQWTPTPGQGSVHAAPGAAKAQEAAAKKKDAIDTLNQLDQAIDAARPYVGPGAGRVTSVEQLVGNADPKAQALGVKMLLGKMKIDAALGGMRAAASPQILARWDNLLANNITPEGLHAATQAMREIMGGGGTSSAPSPSPTPPGKIVVTAPDGSPHTFDTQAQANRFKQLAGIK